MLNKSTENVDAAFLLKQCGFYAGSINRSYYAVYQNILNFYTPSSLDIESASSHENTIKEFCKKFNDFKLRIRVQSEIKELKNMRKKADYSVDEISENDADKALKKSKNIIREIDAHKLEF